MTRATTMTRIATRISLIAATLTLSACFATTGAPIDPSVSGEALVVMDMQRDFVSAEARLPIAKHQVSPLLDAVNQSVHTFNDADKPVLYVVNAFDPSDRVGNWFRNGAAVADTPGAQLDPRVETTPNAALYRKDQPDAFSNDALDQDLRRRQINHLIFVGVFADQCVYWSIRGAQNRGYRVSVVAEGLGAADDHDRRAALDDLRALGVTIIPASDLAAHLTPTPNTATQARAQPSNAFATKPPRVY